MPNKYLEKKGITIHKQKYKVLNWSDYNESLRQRGNIEVWLSDDVINNWCHDKRIWGSARVRPFLSHFIC